MKKLILFFSLCVPSILLGVHVTDFEIEIKNAIETKNLLALLELKEKDEPPYINFCTPLTFDKSGEKKKSLFEIATKMYEESQLQNSDPAQAIVELITTWNAKGYQYELNTYKKSNRLLWAQMKLYDLYTLSTTNPIKKNKRNLNDFIRNNNEKIMILGSDETQMWRLDVITRKPHRLEISRSRFIEIVKKSRKNRLYTKYQPKIWGEFSQGVVSYEIEESTPYNETSWEEIAKLPIPPKEKRKLDKQRYSAKRKKLNDVEPLENF